MHLRACPCAQDLAQCTQEPCPCAPDPAHAPRTLPMCPRACPGTQDPAQCPGTCLCAPEPALTPRTLPSAPCPGACLCPRAVCASTPAAPLSLAQPLLSLPPADWGSQLPGVQAAGVPPKFLLPLPGAPGCAGLLPGAPGLHAALGYCSPGLPPAMGSPLLRIPAAWCSRSEGRVWRVLGLYAVWARAQEFPTGRRWAVLQAGALGVGPGTLAAAAFLATSAPHLKSTSGEYWPQHLGEG